MNVVLYMLIEWYLLIVTLIHKMQQTLTSSFFH